MSECVYIDCSISGEDFICDRQSVIAGNPVKLRFRFSSDWASLSKYANFRTRKSDTNETGQLTITSNVEDVTGLFDGADFLEFGFIGKDGNGNVAKATNIRCILLKDGAYIVNPGATAENLTLVGRLATVENEAKSVASSGENTDIRNYAYEIVMLGKCSISNDTISIKAVDGIASVVVMFHKFPANNQRMSFYIKSGGGVELIMIDDSSAVIDKTVYNSAESVYTVSETIKAFLISDECEIVFTEFRAMEQDGKMTAGMVKQLDKAAQRAEAANEGIAALYKRVGSLEIPASETLEETTLEQLDTTLNGIGSVSGNTFNNSSLGGLAINISGRVYFDVAENTNTAISIDGNKYEADTFDGYVESRIELFPDEMGDSSITFGTIKVAKHTGGILSDEQAEKLITSEKYTTPEKKKLNDTQVFTSEEKNTVSNVSKITDAGYTLVDKTLVELQNEGLLIADEATTVKNVSLIGGTEVTINVGGNVYFSGRKPSTRTTNITVDGVEITAGSATFKYEGYADVIKITDENSISISNVAVQLSEYNGGYMTGEQVKDVEKAKADIEALKANVGNIGAVFDEVHEYAQTLIGGDEE